MGHPANCLSHLSRRVSVLLVSSVAGPESADEATPRPTTVGTGPPGPQAVSSEEDLADDALRQYVTWLRANLQSSAEELGGAGTARPASPTATASRSRALSP